MPRGKVPACTDSRQGRQKALALKNNRRSSYQEANSSISVQANQSYFCMESKTTTKKNKNKKLLLFPNRAVIFI